MDNLTPLIPESIWQIGSLQISNSLLTTQVVFILLFILILLINRLIKIGTVPSIPQLYVEGVYNIVFDFINKITTDAKITYKVISFTLALFLFVSMTSIFVLLPGVDAFCVYQIHL